jgi:hypothetical protein
MKANCLTFIALALTFLLPININAANAVNANEVHASQQTSDKVTGTVYSESGESLMGVFVQIKGTKTAVQTDLDGNYSIQAPAIGKSYTLVFQYLGMETQEIIVKTARSSMSPWRPIMNLKVR